ncbi:bone marrow proteoglycan [Cynocephalus volans]|uniref:bone marrow proteoglycan n=1 Tax=Cynocephalus volans TaxID=110931 RepID=UPI002FCB3F79
MKLLLLLALLFGTVSALHLRTETYNFESSLGDKTLPEGREIPEPEAEEAPPGELMSLEEEEEGGSGSDGAPEEEGAVELVSVLDVEDKGLQCPKEEDTVKLVGSPGFKTRRGYILVRSPRTFDQAQWTCQRCYRGNLVSIHNSAFNYRIQRAVRGLNQGQIWIGLQVIGSGRYRRFCWVDGSSWNYAYWAAGQPQTNTGHCVTLCTQGGHWRRAHCSRNLSFVCSS